jgi:glycosyltransferase involved in cell wall biosynthesis
MDDIPVDPKTPQEPPAAKRSSPIEIRGSIDGFRFPARINGWVVKRQGGTFLTDIHVEVRRSATVIAQTAPTSPRPDATKDETTLAGFLIDLVDIAIVEELISGKVKVFGTDSTGLSQELHFYAPTRQKAIEAIAAGAEPKTIKSSDSTAENNQVNLLKEASPSTPGPLKGSIDRVDHTTISGWAVDTANLDHPVVLEIVDGDEVVANVIADQYRKDLAAGGFGKGYHGFVLRYLRGFSRAANHTIVVRRKVDKLPLPGTLALLEAEPARFENESQRLFARMLATEIKTANHAQDLDQKIEFLLGQTEKLIDARAKLVNSSESQTSPAVRQRWIAALANYIHDHDPTTELRPARPRALVIDYALPIPDHDAGSNAVIGHMLSLIRLGYAVSCVGANTYNANSSAASLLQRMGVELYPPSNYTTVEDVFLCGNHQFDLIYLNRFSPAAAYLSMARDYFPRARLIYSVVDLHFLRFERQAALDQPGKAVDALSGVKQDELALARMADAVVTYSTYEADILKTDIPGKNVHVIPWPIRAEPRGIAASNRKGIAFIGGYLHAPNLDAAKWLATEIMPRVWAFDRDIECFLAGSDMPEELVRLSRDGIIPLGYVRDLNTIFDKVRLTIAPLRFGAGIKGKVLDSLGAGVPCVCTSIAAEGIPFPDPLKRYIADSPESLAELVYRLHSDLEENAACSEAGLELCRLEFSEAKIDSLMKIAVTAN